MFLLTVQLDLTAEAEANQSESTRLGLLPRYSVHMAPMLIMSDSH